MGWQIALYRAVARGCIYFGFSVLVYAATKGMTSLTISMEMNKAAMTYLSDSLPDDMHPNIGEHRRAMAHKLFQAPGVEYWRSGMASSALLGCTVLLIGAWLIYVRSGCYGLHQTDSGEGTNRTGAPSMAAIAGFHAFLTALAVGSVCLFGYVYNVLLERFIVISKAPREFSYFFRFADLLCSRPWGAVLVLFITYLSYMWVYKVFVRRSRYAWLCEQAVPLVISLGVLWIYLWADRFADLYRL